MSVGSNYALERILAAQMAAKQTAQAFGTGLKNQGMALAQMLGAPLQSLGGALSGAHSAMLHPAQTEKAIRQYFSQSMSSPQNAAQFAGENIGPGELAKALVGAKAMAGMTAYHGSPHKFDAFDSSKIGTGEGAQAYGHGLYFAENPDVAKGYSSLGDTFVEMDGKRINAMLTKSGAMDPETYAANAFWRFKGNKDEAIAFLSQKGNMAAEKEAAKLLKKAKQVNMGTGHLYNVDIPDEHINKMLDWDAPLSEQPEAVRKLFNDYQQLAGRDTVGFSAGEYVYNQLADDLGGNNKASEWLRNNGVPGIRYLDAGSRSTKKGTRNFVVFDDSIVKILKRE